MTAWQTPASAPPGWYPDPGRPASLRWWDGATWTEHFAPGWQPPGVFPGPGVPHQEVDYLFPTNRDGLAVTAGYLGLFSLLPNPVTAPAAIACGWIALNRIRTTGRLGRGRAWFGIIVGGISSGIFALAVLIAIFASP